MPGSMNPEPGRAVALSRGSAASEGTGLWGKVLSTSSLPPPFPQCWMNQFVDFFSENQQ